MDALYVALFSWAVSLSGLPVPSEMPVVIKVPHQYFVDNACNGRECKVYGWYAGGRELYVDERMDPEESILAASVVVHEMVHYLQGAARNGGFPAKGAAFGEVLDCTVAIDMESEAYRVQREYIMYHGVYQPVGVSMLRVGCQKDAHPH